jgi:membrane protein YdbS with pleckstrin-like domain
MAKPKRTNYGLRVAFMLPALVIVIVIYNVIGDPSINFEPPALLIPGVVFAAIFSLIITEQVINHRRRRHQSE